MRYRSSALALACALVLAIFATPTTLRGPLLYDDKAAIISNPVVLGTVPLSRVWDVDFWGMNEVSSVESHKSWRPLVTLSYRANHVWHGTEPFGYHCVNVVLHTAVSMLVEPAAAGALCSQRGSYAPALTAIIFAVHPIHVEAVQNIVGRAELMMSLFYLFGFVAYARFACGATVGGPSAPSGARQLLGIGLTLAFTLSATLCKETGVTLPILCAGWDVLHTPGLQPTVLLHWPLHWLLWPLLRPGVLPPPPPVRVRRGRALLLRCSTVLAGGALVAIWRLRRNGGTPATFNGFENPAALHPVAMLRVLSIMWVWAEYAWVVLWPSPLSCDWSYPALPPISGLDDARLPALVRAHAWR